MKLPIFYINKNFPEATYFYLEVNMSEEYSENTKIYPAHEHGMLSIRDMLDYFEKRGALRVSDLG